ncbi:hypothetical protein LOZ66_005604 [Ophidiomyces ophidiicola]|nr:hypothetical protein LOZ66_005604 [Ophidiomyces ophidiicola]
MQGGYKNSTGGRAAAEVQAVSHIDGNSRLRFLYIEGKGQGLSILLHGPPGVGKTLTAEAITELLERPLYSISSGNLSTSAGELEVQLTHIFHIASEWKAVLLLDEADVYLQHRDNVHLERNRLVATFLRTLEYYRGIFFLTTNLLEDFDPAIRDRIHLTLQYRNLDPPARVKIFNHFLNEAEASPPSLNRS